MSMYLGSEEVKDITSWARANHAEKIGRGNRGYVYTNRNGNETLRSYRTDIMEFSTKDHVIRWVDTDTYDLTPTTMRHINAYLDRHGARRMSVHEAEASMTSAEEIPVNI